MSCVVSWHVMKYRDCMSSLPLRQRFSYRLGHAIGYAIGRLISSVWGVS